MRRSQMTRRRILVAAASTAAAPLFIPASALGKDGATAPSERITMGLVGCGGRGTEDLQWLLTRPEVRFVAACDVGKGRRERAKQLIDTKYGSSDCTLHADMREVFARPDIDAVLIATGERWHAPASIAAMQASKDVYCEKPGSMSIAEGQQVVAVAEKTKRIYQTGTQRISDFRFIFATELARPGLLGELKTVRAHLWPAVKDVKYNEHLPAEPLPPDADFNWQRWLGPSPDRPYNKAYLRGCGAWGRFWDFGAGVAGWVSHTGVQCQFATGTELSSPVKYIFPGNKSGEGMVCQFANGVQMVLHFEGWRGSCGVKFEGSTGWASVADGYSRPDVSDDNLLRQMRPIIDDYKEKSGRSLNHLQDFLDCVRSRREPVTNAAVMHRSMTTNHAINICLWLGRDLTWDPAAEQFVSDDEANRMRTRPEFRDPWRA